VLPAVELACGESCDPEVHPAPSATSSATVASAVLPIDQG
jgi:hypothetical protein